MNKYHIITDVNMNNHCDMDQASNALFSWPI